MKRWRSGLFILCYLSLLLYGTICSTLQYDAHRHVGMYFIVWDMFCGWDAFEFRRHHIAEGESGTYYDVTPPWTEFQPYGHTPRHDYDSWGIFSEHVIANTLRHTQHEPITRVFVVEEVWQKKYNLPDVLWKRRFDEPKQPRSYYHIRRVVDSQGQLLQDNLTWTQRMTNLALSQNSGLMEQVTRSQRHAPAFSKGRSPIQPASYSVPANEQELPPSGGTR